MLILLHLCECMWVHIVAKFLSQTELLRMPVSLSVHTTRHLNKYLVVVLCTFNSYNYHGPQKQFLRMRSTNTAIGNTHTRTHAHMTNTANERKYKETNNNKKQSNHKKKITEIIIIHTHTHKRDTTHTDQKHDTVNVRMCVSVRS